MTTAGKQPDCPNKRRSQPALPVHIETRFDHACLMVNATSLGLQESQPVRIDPAMLAVNCAVFDIIAARRTELMQAASARDLQVVDGVAMIRHQLPWQTAFWCKD